MACQLSGHDVPTSFLELYQKNHTGRGEGGFVREIISHFIYQTQRFIGDIEVLSSVIDYSDEQSSESYVMATMRCGEIPVKLFGGVGGNAPDVVEWVLYGTKKSYRFLNWHQLQEGTDDGWVDVEMEETPPHSRHLTAISNMLTGEAHPLADFAVGLKVQQAIETILAV